MRCTAVAKARNGETPTETKLCSVWSNTTASSAGKESATLTGTSVPAVSDNSLRSVSLRCWRYKSSTSTISTPRLQRLHNPLAPFMGRAVVRSGFPYRKGGDRGQDLKF